MSAKPQLSFWYEFASSYTYLSVMRVEQMTRDAGVDLVWRPFLLGPIFASQGWNTSPFNLYPAKGRYMVRDITRVATDRGLSFRMPQTFPVNGLAAARLALVGVQEGWVGAFTRATFAAQFGDGHDISDVAVLASILSELGLDPASVTAASNTPEIKARLKANTQEAQDLGVFGAPSFTTKDAELFWGDDRLEQAVAWARRL